MVLTISPDRRVPAQIVEVLRHAAAAVEAEGVAYFVGGALARDLVLFHVFGEPTTRATRDIDVMVLVGSWARFDSLKNRLVTSGLFTMVSGHPQRLLYGDGGIPLDLVPFGGVEGAAGTIAWPPEREVLMTVAGFREASTTALPIAITDELTVPVVALAALSLLKLTAWLDRRHETNKDAIDLLLLLRRYSAAGNEDRLYDTEVDLLTAAGFDPELAGARLLARDAVRLCGSQVTRSVLERMTANCRRDLEDQVLRQAILLDDTPVQVRTGKLLAGFWSELAAAAAVA